MERDKVIELGMNAGIFEQDGCGVFVCSGDVGEILKFAALVEKETLERAAKVCDHCADISAASYAHAREVRDDDAAIEISCERAAYSDSAKRIRNLKDNP